MSTLARDGELCHGHVVFRYRDSLLCVRDQARIMLAPSSCVSTQLSEDGSISQALTPLCSEAPGWRLCNERRNAILGWHASVSKDASESPMRFGLEVDTGQ
jgi:hypothetical protein